MTPEEYIKNKRRERAREREKIYRSRPEVQAKRKAYMQKYLPEYTKRPEVKERMRKNAEALRMRRRIAKAIELLKENGYSVTKEAE